MLSNCGAGEDYWESLELQGDQNNQSLRYQPWIFIRTDVEAEASILWPSNEKKWLTEKDLDSGKDWGQEKKRATEDEMIWCHHLLNGQEFEQTLGDSERHGCLACWSPWSFKESDTTYQLNNSIFFLYIYFIEVYLTFNVSGAQQVDSVIRVHICYFSGFFFHYSLWEDKRYSSLCYTVNLFHLLHIYFLILAIQHSIYARLSKWNKNVIIF